MSTDISLIVPCFNELNTIQGTVEKLIRFMKERYPTRTFELLIVDDGSSDGTTELLKTIEKNNVDLRCYYFPFNKGRGAAIKAGIANSKGRILIMLDADLSYDEEHVAAILKEFDVDPAVDVVVVSPYMKGGVVQNVPTGRLILSRMANWILAGFFEGKLSTVTCVVRGYRGSLIRALPLLESGKELHLEILRKLSLWGANIQEIPGRLVWKSAREQKRRKTNLRMVGAATRHFLYGFMARPARLLLKASVLLLILGIYETLMMFLLFVQYYQFNGEEGFWRSVWRGLSQTFANSPHTAVIASVALIMSLQLLTLSVLLHLMKMQHDEQLKHLMFLSVRERMAAENT